MTGSLSTDPAGGLATETIGVTGPRLVLVHGFTQTRRCWGQVADDLARDHEVVLVDAPGHGGSAGVMPASFAEGAELIGAVGGRATYVGYSMGGRYALQLAVLRPDLVQRLVLVGASPGLADDDPGARAARRASDEALAQRLEEIGVDAFLDEWLAMPMFAGLDESSRCLAERRTNTVAGLASSLRTAGTGSQPDLWGALPDLTMPVLLVTGADDTKFTALAAEMAAALPRATQVTLPGAGHTAHLEQPATFVRHLRAWLSSVDA